MLEARDFVDLDFGGDSRSVDVAKARLISLLSALARVRENERSKLTQELLEIVVNQREPIERRVQGASMLGFQARLLGIKGAKWIAQSLVEVLENEFLTRNENWSDLESDDLKRLNGQELIFLRNVGHAVLVIHRPTGRKTITLIANLMEGTDTANWFRKLLQRSSE
jgi:hypothetical protein